MATVQTWQAGLFITTGQVIAPVLPNGFVYKSIQPAGDRTGTSEPNWPLVAGATIVDGGVTWEAVTATSITWKAAAIFKSGATEPAWPTTPGATVTDGTIVWRTGTYHVSDPKCPNTKQVVIAASKVFAAGGSNSRDIVRYSATNNPMDWSTQDNAGFLPTGLQAQVDPIVQALGIYRSNLAVWSAGEFQVWQVDPDPSRMALLDSIPSIGSTYYRGHASVSGDLYFMTRLGVRSVTIAGGSTNLQAGDIGTPIDDLVRADLAIDDEPIALFYPAGGQYWVGFGSHAWVYSESRIGGIGAWSRYNLPGVLDYYAQNNGQLSIRCGDKVYLVNESTALDADGVPVSAVVQWPWLDMGQPGVQKMLAGVDLVGSGQPAVSIGYDETNKALFTTPYSIPPDTQPGYLIPIPASAPSFSVKFEYTGTATAWELQSTSLWLVDQRPTS